MPENEIGHERSNVTIYVIGRHTRRLLDGFRFGAMEIDFGLVWM